jgi:hypothetical protein
VGALTGDVLPTIENDIASFPIKLVQVIPKLTTDSLPKFPKAPTNLVTP